MSSTSSPNGDQIEPSIDSKPHKKFNAWQQPGPASYDFRSDVHTTPTESMLEAISNTTLLDDVSMEDPTTNDLEASMASLSGHEAGLLVMSGTMGNQVSLCAHLTGPPHSVLCDHRSHIYVYEAGGVSTLSGAMVTPVIPSNGHHLTLEDVKAHVQISDDVHAAPTKVISLENTLRGMIMPLDEVRRISEFAHSHGIKMHLDGARIWEVACTEDAGSLTEFTSCFDSVSLCFSKGLGAPIGSVIVGSKDFITRARRIRKMIGGGTRQAGVISAACAVAVKETFGHGPRGEGGKLKQSHIMAKKVAQMWTDRGGKLKHPTETNMVWLDITGAGCSHDEWVALGKKENILLYDIDRVVINYQITDESIEKLGRVMDRVFEGNKQSNGSVVENGSSKIKTSYMR